MNESNGGCRGVGRGWGAGGENAAFGGANSCLLGVQTDHPNPAGFRISLRHWAQGATVAWSFETPVQLAKMWGPVQAAAPMLARRHQFSSSLVPLEYCRQ